MILLSAKIQSGVIFLLGTGSQIRIRRILLDDHATTFSMRKTINYGVTSVLNLCLQDKNTNTN